MKKNLLFSLAMFAAGSLMAADVSPKDDVIGAATALGNQPNYSWHTTVETGSASRRGPSDGKTEKDGYTTVSIMANDTTTELVYHGANGVIKTADTGWQTLAEASKPTGEGFNFTAYMARVAQNLRPPAVDAADLASQTQGLTAGTNGISGDLTEEGAKSLLLFRLGGNGSGPKVANPKGSVTFWLHDGMLVKYQTHVSGVITFNGNNRDVDRTTTIEMKDVGTTKVEAPDDAKKKLE